MRQFVWRAGLVALAAATSIAIAAMAILVPAAMLQGWLAAFVWATMAPVGALILLLTHRLTGGAWGEALAPVLEPVARAILPAAVLSAPILVFSGDIYRWRDPAMPATIAPVYMTPPLFAFRAVMALCLWSVLAWFVRARNTPAKAGVALAVLGVITNIVPVDWVIATKPGYHSTAFGFGFAVEQILAALAVCALLGRQRDDAQECRDLAGMLVAILLGTVYFVYVEFAIIWYGNLPDKVGWYVVRSRFPWPEIGAVAFASGALLPFLALLNRHVRSSRGWLRFLGAAIGLGIACHVAWLIAPSFGTRILGPVLAGLVLVAVLSALWLRVELGSKPEPATTPKEALRHG